MKLLSAVIVLAALGPPDWLPPAPDVLFTQVSSNGAELTDNYPAICGGGTCRGALPVAFAYGNCLVSAWVEMPRTPADPGQIQFSAGLCTADPNLHSGQTGGEGKFRLDAHGAASVVVPVLRDDSVIRDLVRRADDQIFIRVDIIAATHAHR
jgi:hypothetical protein